MKITLTILTFVAFGISMTSSCADNAAVKLKSLKASGCLYPKGKIKLIKALNFIDTQYVWVNTSYKNYSAKDLFSELVNFEFNLKDARLASIVKSDTFALCDILSQKLRTKGIAHFIGQSLLNDRLNVYFYSDHDSNVFSAAYDLKIQTKTTFSEDPSWDRYFQLLEKK